MSPYLNYLKAFVGALVAALSMLGGFLINDTAIGDITAGQWVAVAIAFLTGLTAVWAIPNIKPPPVQ
jgi:hypothetical protein